MNTHKQRKHQRRLSPELTSHHDLYEYTQIRKAIAKMASTQAPAQKPAEQAQAPQKDQKTTPALEEDDEFEDFPVEGT